MILNANNKAVAFARKYVDGRIGCFIRSALNYPHQCAYFYYVNYRRTIRDSYAGSLPPESAK